MSRADIKLEGGSIWRTPGECLDLKDKWNQHENHDGKEGRPLGAAAAAVRRPERKMTRVRLQNKRKDDPGWWVIRNVCMTIFTSSCGDVKHRGSFLWGHIGVAMTQRLRSPHIPCSTMMTALGFVVAFLWVR